MSFTLIFTLPFYKETNKIMTLFTDGVIMAAWHYATNAKSILGVKRRRAWLVLGWVTSWGVEVSVKLRTLEPSSA